ncbi:hypothetical protein [Sphingomonas sp.]|uniref:hypothetical protein n=1 Tax=Sphingomonas sp. TaxID=28214 RepID=UPI003D6D3AE8
MSPLYGIWRILDVERTRDVPTIRAAYARALKSFDIDDEPARYAALRDARDAALAYARQPQSDDDASDGQATDPEEAILPGITIPLPDFATGLSAPTLFDASPPDTPIAITPIPPDGDFRPVPPELVPAAEERILPLVEVTLTPPVLDLGEAPPLQPINGLPPGFAEAMDQRYNAVLSLLFPQDERRHYHVRDPDLSALRDHVAVLLADPRMEEIAFRADADRWFANVVAQSIPRSDPILDMVMTAFGWLDSRGRIDQPPVIAAIVARHDSLAFVTRVQSKDHPLRKAWRELTTPAQENSWKGIDVSGAAVRSLLVKIRREYPDLEDMFDSYRVSLWEASSFSNSKRNWVVWVIGAWIALTILSSLGGLSNTSSNSISPSNSLASDTVSLPPGQAELSAFNEDLDAILEKVGGRWLDYDILKRKNPTLYNELAANWTAAKRENVDREGINQGMVELLTKRYGLALRQADYDIVAAYARLTLNRMKKARSMGADACEALFTTGKIPQETFFNDTDQQKEIIARTLTAAGTRSTVQAEPGTIATKKMFVNAAAGRAHQPHELFVASMMGKGTAKSRCDARIALIETALAVPPEMGLEVLRLL